MPKQLRRSENPVDYALGMVGGSVNLPKIVRTEAAALAQKYYDEAEADEFSGDPVGTLRCPRWMVGRRAWLPEKELIRIGYRRARGAAAHEELVLTVGCDEHFDSIHGPVFILVLHNDGLTFKQLGQKHVTQVGEWFVFDDHSPHEVVEARKSTTYVGWAVALEEVDGGC
jgi:hypothetical protein